MKFTNKNGSIRDIQAVWIERESLPEVYFIDQRFIPFNVEILTSKSVQDTAKFIQDMVIRGAPSIGAAAAYGMVQSFIQHEKTDNIQKIMKDAKILLNARPTAVDLQNSISRMLQTIKEKNTLESVITGAETIVNEIISECQAIAKIGTKLLNNGISVLHHCHTGALATVDIGTALGVLIQAHKSGKRIHVYVDETRPRLQGGRITDCELSQERVPHTEICDSADAFLL